MIYQARIDRAREMMRQKGIDLLVLTHSTDLFYLTGIKGNMMERLACLLLTQTQASFIAPGFELGNLKPEAGQLITPYGWIDGEDPFHLVKRIAADAGAVAAMGRTTPSWVLLGMMECCPKLSWASADDLMIALRSVKDEYEYQMLRQVQHKACAGLARVIEHGVCGMREMEVLKLLQEYCAQEGVVFQNAIVGSGPNSALPHHHTGDRVIEKGDVVVIDFGGEEPDIGYQADTTRTFCVGSIPDGFAEVYDIVNRANQAAFEASLPGTPCEDVDRAARNVIAEAGYGDYFTHRVGHGLGLDIHEHPYLSAGNSRLIQPGNVFSDEPGIYIPDKFGVRIEDQIIARESGPERLTPMEGLLSHDLRVIE